MKRYAAAIVDLDADVEEIALLVVSAANALYSDNATDVRVDEINWENDTVSVVLAGDVLGADYS